MIRPIRSLPCGSAARNERGVALLIVLIVVALLTVTVMEFTYSVQIDQHRTRNAIHALQAQLLARSGINLAEGFLMLDDEPSYDAYSELWWQQLVEFCNGLQLEESMRIRCSVRDESGKLNVNNTRGIRRPPQPQNAQQQQTVTTDMVLRDALKCLFQNRGINLEPLDKLPDYWAQEPTQLPDGRTQEVPQFTSLEDFGATLGIPADDIRKLRGVVTAERRDVLRGINVNTAPAEVLAAVLTDNPGADCGPNEAVNAIVERQCDPDQPFKSTGEIKAVLGAIDNLGPKASAFTVQSKLYRLEASGVTNVDPSDPSGVGIGQTLSSLVARHQGLSVNRSGQAPQVGQNGKPIPNWTLRPMDWQKEGGARLFRNAADQDPCSQNESQDEEGRENDDTREQQ
jgi:type II secretory pathway component PulK